MFGTKGFDQSPRSKFFSNQNISWTDFYFSSWELHFNVPTLKIEIGIFITVWQNPVTKNQQQVFKDCLQYFYIQGNNNSIVFLADWPSTKIPWSGFWISGQFCRRSQILGISQPMQLAIRIQQRRNSWHDCHCNSKWQTQISTHQWVVTSKCGWKFSWGGQMCIATVVQWKLPGIHFQIQVVPDHCSGTRIQFQF